MSIKETICAEIERLIGIHSTEVSDRVKRGVSPLDCENDTSMALIGQCHQLLGFLDTLPEQPVEINIDNPNIEKIDPSVKVETRTDGTGEIDGKAMLYVAEKQYERGKKDGYREGFDEGYKRANEAMSFHYNMFHNSTPCYAPGGVCTNPQMDCVNCPRQNSGEVITKPNTSCEK